VAYELKRRLAVGGMAELFLAHEVVEGRYRRTVVIKTVRREESDYSMAAARLRAEWRIGQVLDHPNVIRMLGGELDRGRPYLVLEFVFGRDLGQLGARCQQRGIRVPSQHVRTIVSDLLSALDYCYFDARLDGRRARAVHRDISPTNVLVGFDGVTRLLDFGLSEGRHGALRPRGANLGKRPYRSPEEERGGRLDHRSDLYSAGILCRELAGDLRELPALKAWVSKAVRAARWRRPSRARSGIRAASRGETRSVGAARQELASWLHGLYAEPMARRAAELAELTGGRAVEVADAGFELLREGAVTEDLAGTRDL